MGENQFRKTAIRAAICAAFVLSASPVISLEVGQPLVSSNGKIRISGHYDSDHRDVEQNGNWNLWTETEITQISPTETVTESLSNSFSGIKAEQEQEKLYAKLSAAVTPRIEVYGKVGVTRTKLKDMSGDFTEAFSECLTDTLANTSLCSTESISLFDESIPEQGSGDFGLLAGGGVKAIVHEWQSGLKLLLDGQYEYSHGDSSQSLFFGIDINDVTSHEWQASLMLSKDIKRSMGTWSPYGGVKYGISKTEYDTHCCTGAPAFTNPDGTLKMENQDRVGIFGGLGFISNSGWTLGIEGRFLDESAINANVGWHFY